MTIERPIVRIPSLAIHLDREINQSGFKPNLRRILHLSWQLTLKPSWRVSIIRAMVINNNISSGGGETMHHPIILAILAEELKCEQDDIVDFELNVCDTQKSHHGGASIDIHLWQTR